MKTLALLTICLIVFAAIPVLACSSGDGGDKEGQQITANAQMLGSCGGCNKPKAEPKPEADPEPTCGKSCDKDKGDTPDPKPDAL